LLGSHKTSDIPPLVSAFQKLKFKRNIKRNSKKKRIQEEKIVKRIRRKKAISEGLGAYGCPMKFENSFYEIVTLAISNEKGRPPSCFLSRRRGES